MTGIIADIHVEVIIERGLILSQVERRVAAPADRPDRNTWADILHLA